MAISNMQQARQLRAGGGIMAIPRQKYGFGKLVRKITRPIRKIAKSPIGKAALLYAGTAGLGALGAGGAGTGFTKAMFSPGNVLSNIKFGLGRLGLGSKLIGPPNPNKVGFFKSLIPGANFSGKNAFLAGTAGLTALPFLMGNEEDEEEIVDTFEKTPSTIADIRLQSRMKDPSLDPFRIPDRFTQRNYYLANGGVVGLANGGDAGEQQMMQMLQAEYMKYRQNGGTMPFKQFAQMVMQQSQTQMAANGGRIGYQDAGPVMQEEVINEDTQEVVSNPDPLAELNALSLEVFGKPYDMLNEKEQEALMNFMSQNPEEEIIDTDETMVEDRVMAADGGMMDYMSSANPMADSYIMEDEDVINMYRPGGERQMAAEGGIMDKRGLVDGPGGYAGKGGKKKSEQASGNIVEMTNFENAGPGYGMGWMMSLLPYLTMMKNGGRVPAQEGGIMDLGGMEKDYREEGGFVPIGGQEKADDVPARLSKNEFVFTADAVRNAGGGDIDKGSAVMQRMMDNLEQGGEISEESQGMNPAQEMFDTAQQLESRIV